MTAPAVAERAVALEAMPGHWRVERGSLSLFAMRRAAGAWRGRRVLLLRLAAGEGLCCVPAAAGEPEVDVLAVGSADAVLVAAPEARAAGESWIGTVAAAMQDPGGEWAERLGSPGEIGLPKDALMGCAGRQLLWADVLEGAVSAGGEEPVGPGASPVAVLASRPLRALAPSRLRLRASAELSDTEWEAALAGHRAGLLRHALAVLAAAEAQRGVAVAGSVAAAGARLAEGLEQLAGRHRHTRPGDAGGDPVWRALALVAEATGQPLAAQPTGSMAGLDAAGRLAAYAEHLALPLRPVLLRGRWWRQDHGPLLAWRQGGTEAVALRPGWRGYRRFDPTQQRWRRLGARAAAALEPAAWMLYRGLPPGPVGARRLLHHILAGLPGERGRLLWLSLAAAALSLAAPVAMGILAGTVIPHSDRAALLTLGAGLLAAACGAACVELTRGLLLQRIEARVTLDTQAALFDRLLRLPADFFRRFGAGDLADRVLVMDRVRRSLTGARLNGAFAGVVALGNAAVMLACDLWLGLLGVALALLAAAAGLWLCVPQARQEQRQAEHRGRTENLVLEAIGGVGKLKVAAATDRVLAAWLRRYGAQHRAFVAAGRAKLRQAVFAAGFLPLALAAVFLLAASLDLAARAPVALPAGMPLRTSWPAGEAGLGFGLGAWFAFSCAFGQLMAGVWQMLHSVGGALAVVPLYARARPILQAVPESGQADRLPAVLSGGIAFSQVSFAYAAGAAQVLHGLSFAVRPGEFVAIVGPSGSGKSTVLRLLLGFEQPTAGAVLLDGRPLATLNAAAVRRQLGAVLQTGRLQAGSILDNIGGDAGTGRPLELADAWHAAELAGLAGDIRGLPMGMYTMLPEAGGSLSGGQRQRLLIARALARRPRLLLLDEATSALDNRTQSVVAEAIAGLGLTRLVVAHRLTTIAAADRILVLDQGRLVQSGGFQELLDQPGLFRELARQQLP